MKAGRLAPYLVRTLQVQTIWHSGPGSANHLGRGMCVFKPPLQLFRPAAPSAHLARAQPLACMGDGCLLASPNTHARRQRSPDHARRRNRAPRPDPGGAYEPARAAERAQPRNAHASSRETWTEFRHSDELEVAIFTGTGRAFCAGEDMKESLANGAPGGTAPGDRGPVHVGRAGKAGDRRGQRLRHGRRLHAGRAHRPARRRARRGVRGVRGEALAARRLQPRPRRQPAVSDRDGDGARLPLHRRALLRRRLPEPPGRCR